MSFRYNGLFLAVLSSLIFSFMNVLAKALTATIPLAQIVFFRSFIGVLVVVTLMIIYKVRLSRKNFPLLLLRGFLGSFYLFATFFAISKIKLADASILSHLSPVFVVFLAIIILKEKTSKHILGVLLLAIIGTVVILRPNIGSLYTQHALIGVLGALFAAGASISIRYLSREHHTYEIILYFLGVTAILSFPQTVTYFRVPNLPELAMLIGIGVVSFIGQYTLTKAFTYEKAGNVASVRYVGILFNTLWGFLFWNEAIDLYTLLGGSLVLSSCFLLTRIKK